MLALTRRGQGESAHPETGYDIDTLVDDIYGFMEILKLEKAVFAGHSLAGVELIYFTEKYSQKVIKLVFLDAVYDGKGRMDVFEHDPLKEVQNPNPKKEFSSVEEYADYVKYIRPDLAQIWNDTWDQVIAYDLTKDESAKYIEKDTSSIGKQMLDAMIGYNPKNANIKVPLLSLVAISEPTYPDYLTGEQKQRLIEFAHTEWHPFQQKEIAFLKKNIPHAKVVELSNSHHYCFISDEDFVYEETRKFLLE